MPGVHQTDINIIFPLQRHVWNCLTDTETRWEEVQEALDAKIVDIVKPLRFSGRWMPQKRCLGMPSPFGNARVLIGECECEK
jgi:hypothetical protein